MRPTDRPTTAFWLRIEQWMNENVTPWGKKPNQSDIAAALGITSSAVSGWKLGPSVPSMNNLESLASFTGIPFDELVGLVQAQVLLRKGQKSPQRQRVIDEQDYLESQDPGGVE